MGGCLNDSHILLSLTSECWCSLSLCPRPSFLFILTPSLPDFSCGHGFDLSLHWQLPRFLSSPDLSSEYRIIYRAASSLPSLMLKHLKFRVFFSSVYLERCRTFSHTGEKPRGCPRCPPLHYAHMQLITTFYSFHLLNNFQTLLSIPKSSAAPQI